ncbi:target of rapamycin complex 2 subunit MAPKAP1 [Striga asiatica]|uniref:Target of rapamycin complex 2 subunit MAPKAP1 n=1 Tax=Striga asiatica TaxID=4170 RepID=A0A5A7QDE3_STRAF|nr:target of rapamycin complex 2 subunit MAPKAP1 [Striga asiatica]
MANSEEQSGGQIDNVEPADQRSDGGDAADAFPEDSVAASEPSVTRRLTEIFVADGDGDLLLQSTDPEGGFLQWFRALDMQVVGACRTDERLKPLLKLNVSAGVAEDGLLAHLSQHFEPSEVGLLARCLCVPLVSIRVGKIDKQGALMYPTSIRGNLFLTLLPTSDLRVSFNGDDGTVERLATLGSEVHSGDLVMEEISADKSGRSFLIKTPDNIVSYFWCCEKSKLLGDELLAKVKKKDQMKDLVVKKPSLAALTGISEWRLSYFATHLRAYLTDTMLSSGEPNGFLSADDPTNSTKVCSSSAQSVSNFRKNLRQYTRQGSKSNLIYLGSLSPKSSCFKEGLQKSGSSLRSGGSREKLRRRGENYMACVGSQSVSTVAKNKVGELNISEKSTVEKQIPCSSGSGSLLSPQYCWCPQLPIGEPFSLPPLSSLLLSSSSKPKPKPKPVVNVADLPPLDFGGVVTSIFTPPIVHVPVIDVVATNVESAVEKGARETLRMLINGNEQKIFYSGARDVVTSVSATAATTVGLVFLVTDDCQEQKNPSGPADEEGGS